MHISIFIFVFVWYTIPMKSEECIAALKALIENETDKIAILSNASALLKESLPDTNWVGFYLKKDGALVLGPFQGKVACMHIGIGKGVCGAAMADNCTKRVDDVHAFCGHIACDSASNAEIVIPIRDASGVPVAVLDVDSATFARFTKADQIMLEAVAECLSRQCFSK